MVSWLLRQGSRADQHSVSAISRHCSVERHMRQYGYGQAALNGRQLHLTGAKGRLLSKATLLMTGEAVAMSSRGVCTCGIRKRFPQV